MEQNEEKNTNTTNQEEKITSEQPKNKSTSQLIWSGILGGVISAMIVVLLFTTDMIPINEKVGGSSASTQTNEAETESPRIINTIASDNADVASNIDEASKAVVSVLNKQQKNIWAQSQEAGAGSGIIYKKENGKAYVVTNNHVVEGAETVEVVLKNDEHVEASVLGADALSDLAVLEIDGSKIDVIAELGSSGDLQIGETVIAIGNPLGMDLSGSVTRGIISGLERSIPIDTNGDNQPDWITEVIQTDAAINPGNSGGALVNADGKVIGINSMKIARQEVEGIGFAIPSDSALPIMEQLEKDGSIARPFIGVSTASLNQVPPQYRDQITLPEDIEGGMVVADVESGSPADRVGLQQFDIITKINDQEITSILDLRKYMYSETSIGDSIEMEYYRDGKPQTVEMELTERNK
ncbi:S1C family serine protease [Virgibacillus byunsanensis]|uniref:S1C family serine protease n=1 Tax=Virgibacillus byunsanensis TaxID=570945 RepID=A0ABW3LKH0_9BACI